MQDARDTAGMKISTVKTEKLQISRNPDQCPLQVNGATPKQVGKFKYLVVDSQVTESKTKKATLSIFKAVFVPILTCGHETWVMTERMRLQVQESEMCFSQRIEGVTLFNKVRN